MRTLTLTDDDQKIIARLYFEKDGQLHPDSWIRTSSEPSAPLPEAKGGE